MTEDNKELILFRLREAKEALDDAKMLLEKTSYRASINRSYYSMFYSMICLAYSIGIETSKHAHVISTFDKEFVKSGKFTKENSKWVHEAFKKRQESDYLDFKEVNLDEAEKIYFNAERFLSLVINYFHDTYSLFF